MSELKVYRFLGQDEVWPDANLGSDYYLKSEADAIIAEKDAEIARLKAIRKVHVEAIESMGAGLQQNEEEILHLKYKRCLTMADMCQEALCYWDNVKYTYFKGEAYCFRKLNHYGRWGQIWLAIAEKFKEAK